MKSNRLLVSFLALAMLAGCGSKQAAPAGTDTNEKTEEKTEETVVDLGPLFERGVIDGQSYSNATFGFRADFSDDWVLSDDDDIATMSQQTSETLTNETAKEKIQDGSALLDFYAQNPRSGETVNVYLEDTGVPEVDIEKVIPFNVKAIEKELANQQFEDVTVETAQAEFLGRTVPCVIVNAKYAGLDFYERQVYVSSGRNLACITSSSFYNDTTQDVLSIFSE